MARAASTVSSQASKKPCSSARKTARSSWPGAEGTGSALRRAGRLALRSSKTISDTTRELDLNTETLRGWVKKHKQRNEPAADAELTLSERARLKELERRVREVEMENAFLKKCAAYFARDPR
ncbi:transposase [Streptomyces sp. ET3-23]|nr:transposase [Streptomyces sp. ET3-23]